MNQDPVILSGGVAVIQTCSCSVTPLMDAVRGDHVAMTTFLIHDILEWPVNMAN